MGVKGVDALRRGLLEHGMAADTPAAIVQQGTMPEQKTYAGTVGTLTEIVSRNDIKPPSMIIIGEVARLHKKLSGRRGDPSSA